MWECAIEVWGLMFLLLLLRQEVLWCVLLLTFINHLIVTQCHIWEGESGWRDRASPVIGPPGVGVATRSDESRYSDRRCLKIWPSVGFPLGECDGDGVVFVCLWFLCQFGVYTPVMLHIWPSTLINHVLCIFWRFPQISVAAGGIRLPSLPAVHRVLTASLQEEWLPPRMWL